MKRLFLAISIVLFVIAGKSIQFTKNPINSSPFRYISAKR